MKAVIAQYYNTEEAAVKKARQNMKEWGGKLAWHVLCAKNGYFVISEIVARKLYPDENFSYRDRKVQTLL